MPFRLHLMLLLVLLLNARLGACADGDTSWWKDTVVAPPYRAVNADDIRKKLQLVERQLAELLLYTQTAPDRGKQWRAYLQVDEQRFRFEQNEPGERTFWRAVLHRCQRSAPGMHHQSFARYRSALRELLRAQHDLQEQDGSQSYQELLNDLGYLLNSRTNTFSEDDYAEINRLLSRLHRRAQGEKVIQEVQSRISKPNILLNLPERLETPTSIHHGAVSTTINGARVTGRATTESQLRLSLVRLQPIPAYQAELIGISNSYTTSVRGRVATSETSNFSFESITEISLRNRTLVASPFVTAGDLDMHLQAVRSINGRPVGPIARMIAERRHPQSKFAAQRDSSDRLNRFADQSVGAIVQNLNDYIEQRVLNPLLCLDLLPPSFEYAHHDKGGKLAWSLTADGRLAATSDPSRPSDAAYPSIQLHRSAFENVLTRLLAARRTPFELGLRMLFGESGKAALEQSDLVICFDSLVPATVSFEDDEIEVSLFADHFVYEGKRYAPMVIRLRYAIDLLSQQPGLRLKETNVAPRVGPDGSRPRLGVRDIAFRRVLINSLRRLHPERIELPDSQGQSPDLRDLEASEGWLTFTFGPFGTYAGGR